MTSRVTLWALSFLLIGLIPTDANSCSCKRFDDWGFVHPAIRELPAESTGIYWYGSSEVSESDDPPSFRIVEISSGGKRALAIALTRVLTDHSRSLWLVSPREPMHSADQYEFSTSLTVGGSEQRLLLTRGPTPLRMPAEPPTLELSSMKLGELKLAAAASCSTVAEVVYVSLEMKLPPEIEPFREQLFYETRVDGKHKWVADESMCAPRIPGRGRHGPGRDIVFALCEGRGSVLPGGLGPAQHSVSMRAYLPGTPFDVRTPEVLVRLECAGETFDPLAPPVQVELTEAQKQAGQALLKRWCAKNKSVRFGSLDSVQRDMQRQCR